MSEVRLVIGSYMSDGILGQIVGLVLKHSKSADHASSVQFSRSVVSDSL